MVNNDLKKLSRRDLIDIIYQMKKNEQKMEAEILSLKTELEDKRLRISNSGSIADAAASVSGIFSAAQEAADLYLYEISCIKKETEMERIKIINETNETVSKILSEVKKQYSMFQERYKADYMKWKKICKEIDSVKNDKNRE